MKPKPILSGENQPAFLRLFVALSVPAVVRGEIARAQGQLKRCSPPGLIRWTKPEQFHLTLKFLGDMPSAQLELLEASVAEVCHSFPPVSLSAEGVGFFPNARKPRVIWAGALDGTGNLAELHRRIHAAVLPLAPADSSDRFSSHITLGRFKPGHHGSMKSLLERAARLAEKHYGGWLAEGVEIIRSDLTPDGAVHTPVCVCRLAGRKNSGEAALGP
jgi:2'-5' RNA ligase